MTDRVIYVDLDGCLTDFVSRCFWAFNSDLKETDITGWNIEKFLGITEDELWFRIDNKTFWADMAPYPWFEDLWAAISKYGRPVILTSPGRSTGACAGKLQWIQNQLGHTFEDWMFMNHKELIAKPWQILIDDSDKKCDRWEAAGGIAIRFPQYWNSLSETRKCMLYDPIVYVRSQLERWVPKATEGQFNNNQTDGR